MAKIKKHYVQLYREALNPFLSLKSNCAKHFLLWIAFDGWGLENGEFYYGRMEYTEFSEFMKSLGEKPYRRNTLDVAITELRKTRLIIRLERGRYIINPEFLWIGPTAERPAAIKKIKELEKIKGETVA